MTFFAKNLTATILDLKFGQVKIGPFSYISITQSDKDHDHFKDAVLRGWLEITDKEPGAATVVEPPLVITEVSPFEGLSEEDFKASLDEDRRIEAEQKAIKDAELQARVEEAQKANIEEDALSEFPGGSDTLEPTVTTDELLVAEGVEEVTAPTPEVDSAVENEVADTSVAEQEVKAPAAKKAARKAK